MAGRKVKVGDTIIIAAYAYLEDNEVEFFAPKIVLMEEGNRVG
jgi:aspartate 1-decarboxylase